MYPTDMLVFIQNDIYTRLFTAALFPNTGNSPNVHHMRNMYLQYNGMLYNGKEDKI